MQGEITVYPSVMEYPDTASLAKTIENVSEALFFGFDITEGEKQAVADFLVSRHHAPGAYANMFAPTEEDMKHDLVLFTGEEASRILYKLGLRNEAINTALRESDEGIIQRMKESGSPLGSYCCRTCSCSLWLNVSAGGLNRDARLLKAGLEFLKQHREEKGTWKGFPYHYTLYALNEIGAELALDEMRFAARSVERWIKRKPKTEDKIALRRHTAGERILSKV